MTIGLNRSELQIAQDLILTKETTSLVALQQFAPNTGELREGYVISIFMKYRDSEQTVYDIQLIIIV